jgi:hypothetical protein
VAIEQQSSKEEKMPVVEGSTVKERLLRAALGQPLLPTSLSFPFLGFASDAWLLIIAPALQFPEQAFTREFLLGNLESFLDVVVENFDFHFLTTFDSLIGFSAY